MQEKLNLGQKACKKMKENLKYQKQTNLFSLNLIQIVNPAHELVLLANKIDWKEFDISFSCMYSQDRPSFGSDPGDGVVAVVETAI